MIDWLNQRAKGFTSAYGDELVTAYWTTGKVGMTGTSYNGTLPLAAATTGVEGLEAIIPVSPNTSYYHYYRSHGLVRHPGGYMGEDVDVLYDFIHSGDPEYREYCNSNVRDGQILASIDRESGDYNEFWAGRDYINGLDKVRAATLIAHGFNDWNVMPEHSVRIYAGLKERGVPCMAYFHQGGHGGAPPKEMMNRWFTRYLYGVENDVEQDARAWVAREGVNRKRPTPYADYPNPKAQAVTLHLGAGGRKRGSLGLSAVQTPGQESLIDDVSEEASVFAQAGASEQRLLYVTPTLKQPLHLSGTSQLTIRMAADAPAANLSIWIVSLPWTKSRKLNDNLITRGWADPQNHSGQAKGEPLVPGEFVEWTFALQPDDQIVPAGQSIGLMIFSSDREFTLWPDPGTRLTVDLAATQLQLPVVGGLAAYRTATGTD